MNTRKSTPFPHSFTSLKTGITHPEQAVQFFKQVEEMDSIEYCVLDGFNYLMDMFESVVVNQSTNTMKSWGEYADFIKNFMQQVIGPSKKKWIIIAHNNEELTPEGEFRYYVPIKGSAAKIGIESYFNVVVYAQRQKLSNLNKYDSDPELLHITTRDERLGYKHVFQVQPTKEVANGRIRDLDGMWEDNQIWIDNDAQLLMDHLSKYYGG